MKEIIERAERLGYKPYCKSFVLNTFAIPIDDRFKYIELCLIQKWLREEKGFIIDIDYYFAGITAKGQSITKGYDVIVFDEKDYGYNIGVFKIFEQALEEGIKKALEILEK